MRTFLAFILGKKAKPAPQPVAMVPPPFPLSLEDCHVFVCFPEPGLTLLRKQLDLDINQKARGWNPVPFMLIDLVEVDRLVNRTADKQPIQAEQPALYSHPERKLITRYVAWNRQRARQEEAWVKFAAYDQLLVQLLNRAIKTSIVLV